MSVSPSRSGSASDAAEGDQLQLEQPLTDPHVFADLGTSRCEHESVRGNRCTNSGRWDGLSGLVLCDDHANEAA